MSVLKPFLISILILSNLGTALLVPVIYLDFEMRQDYIAKVLCVERDKPMTVCGGSCYLADQLNKAQKNQEESGKTLPKDFTFFLDVYKQFSINSKPPTAIQDLKFHSLSDSIVESLFSFDIFHPPRLG